MHRRGRGDIPTGKAVIMKKVTFETIDDKVGGAEDQIEDDLFDEPAEQLTGTSGENQMRQADNTLHSEDADMSDDDEELKVLVPKKNQSTRLLIEKTRQYDDHASSSTAISDTAISRAFVGPKYKCKFLLKKANRKNNVVLQQENQKIQ